ncbi:MAG: BTAD domain-containing putative transcriptional regulator [Anaerolineales bacterium]
MLQIFLLGSPHIILNGNAIQGLTSIKSKALLYYLAMNRRPMSRLTLAGLLWPEKNDTEARTNLRQAVRQLRQVLGDAEEGGYLMTTRDALAINENLPFDVDAMIFEWMANAGLNGDMQVLQSAVNRYQGEFLSGFYLEDAYGIEEWVLLTRERLRSLMIQCLLILAHYYAEQSEIKSGLDTVRQLLEIEPWREEAHRLMMQFLAWNGQISAALSQYERCRDILLKEMGTKPGVETLALYEAIRTNRIPRKVFLTGEPKPQAISIERPNNLPPQQYPFIGRKQELLEIKRLISTQSTRDTKPLVTLVGTGGAGKTRLALQIGAELLPHFSDGVWFIQLATITDPDLVPQALSTALGLQERMERAPLDLIQEHFRGRTAMLILDNCEQVVQACAEVVRTLHTKCPSLTILVTSRELLKIPGEISYPIPPMTIPNRQALPPFDELLQFDSIRLFVERALTSWPAFPFTPSTAPYIVEICQQLDGIPLAIELAAVRVNALSVEKILERLSYRFQLLTQSYPSTLPQHRTLLASVDWSYDLLDIAERALLQRLSIFSGGWSLEAAEAICADTPEGLSYSFPLHPMEILDLLTRLVDKSLVQIPEVRGEETRYHLLETIRQYAQRKLREVGEETQASENHARFYLRLVIQANPMLRSAHQKEWTSQLTTEQANIRAALNWWLQTNPSNALQMAGLLGRYWDRKGFYMEGRETLAKALSIADTAPIAYKIKALKWASGLAMRQASYDTATMLAEEGLALSRAQDHPANIATFLNILGLIASGQGQDHAAQIFLEENVHIQRSLGDPWGLASSLDNLSNVTRAIGNPQKALEYMLECLEITRKLGDNYLIANNLVGAAECYLDLNQLQTAHEFLEEAILIQQEIGDQQGLAIALGELGIIAWLQQNKTLSLRYQEKSLQIRQQIGDKNGEGYMFHWMGLHALERKEFPLAEQYLKDGLAIGVLLGNQRNSINCIRELGNLAMEAGNLLRAVKLWAACEAWQKHTQTPMRVIFHAYQQTKIAQARNFLGDHSFQSIWSEGWNMSFEQLAAYANESFVDSTL